MNIKSTSHSPIEANCPTHYLHFRYIYLTTRQSSCMTARGVPTAAYHLAAGKEGAQAPVWTCTIWWGTFVVPHCMNTLLYISNKAYFGPIIFFVKMYIDISQRVFNGKYLIFINLKICSHLHQSLLLCQRGIAVGITK